MEDKDRVRDGKQFNKKLTVINKQTRNLNFRRKELAVQMNPESPNEGFNQLVNPF